MLDIVNHYGYLGVFLLILIENIFPPIPSEVVLLFGGALTVATKMNIPGVIIASTAGSLIGAIVLQIFLSRRESPWPGLVLPGTSLLLSLIPLLNVAALPGAGAGDILTALLLVFVLYNIPTLVLVAIYFACRAKFRRRREMDRMNAQDLE